MKYYLGLGSNLGERSKNLARAVHLLRKSGVQIIKKSAVYETSPIGVLDQPWFLNQVIEVRAAAEPMSLLALVKNIEKKMGRIPTMPKGTRCIDIDILLAESRIVRTAKLTIPHPELANRNFVLLPLSEIASDILHPVLKEKIGDLRRTSKDKSIARIYKPA